MMSPEERKEARIELELARLMVKDLEKLWKSYAKKAQAAKEERERRQEKKGFLEYETLEELTEAYGYAVIDEETYIRGQDYFKSLSNKAAERSLTETHRERIKELLNRYKGTVEYLEEELDPPKDKDPENGFEAYDREQRNKRCEEMRTREGLDEFYRRQKKEHWYDTENRKQHCS